MIFGPSDPPGKLHDDDVLIDGRMWVSRQLWDEVGPWRQAAAERIEQINELLRSMEAE